MPGARVPASILYYHLRVAEWDLITVGESFEDLIFFDLPRLPGPGEEVKTNGFEPTVGGGALITAVTAARLGLRCSVVSGLGPSACELLIEERIHFLNLIEAGEHHAVSVALSTKKDRSFVTYNGVNTHLEERLFGTVGELDARHIHFAFYPKHCGRWVEVVHRIAVKERTTSWDFGWNEGLREDDRFMALVEALDLVFLNEDEAILYSGRSAREEAAGFWKDRARNTLIKRGERGCRWLSRKQDLLSPAVPAVVVDTTGAGDAWNGGFLTAWLRDETPERCLELANRVASLSTRAPGGIAGLPHRSEIE